MTSHRHQGFVATNNPSPMRREIYDISEGVQYIRWAQRLKGERKPGAWSRTPPTRINNEGGDSDDNDDEEEFRWSMSNDTNVESPRMWEKVVPDSHTIHPAKNSTLNQGRNQLIAKYRNEMLESMRGVPESEYELSLQDLVQMPKVAQPTRMHQQQQEEEEEKQEQHQLGQPSIVKNGYELLSPDHFSRKEKRETEHKGAITPKTPKRRPRKRMSRSETMDGGAFLLKMFLPFSFSRRRNKTSEGLQKMGPPKPVMADNVEMKTERNSSSSSTNSTTTSIVSSSSSSTNSTATSIASSISSSSSRSANTTTTSIVKSRRKLNGCYSFFIA